MDGTPSSPPRSDAEPLAPSYELLAHTAEVRVRVRGADVAGLACAAGRALAEIELAGAPRAATGAAREIRVRSPDDAALIVDFLNELIFLAETERWVATEFAAGAAQAAQLVVSARGVTVPEAPARVKAATHHGLAIRPVAGGLEAELVLDV
jgi:SHS2 domain-containing protein